MKSFKEFQIAMNTDENFKKELLAYIETKAPSNDAEYTKCIADFALEKGYDVTVEQLSMKKAAERELDEDELDIISGGSACESTWQFGENCWSSDRCDHIVNDYKGFPFCQNTAQPTLCVGSDLCAIVYHHYEGHVSINCLVDHSISMWG